MKHRFLSAAVVAVAGLLVLSASVAFAAPHPKAHYVAMGDSVAVGQGAKVEHRFGYVGRFGHRYRVEQRGPERMTNLAVRGESSSTILGDQLSSALEVIGDEETDVEVVTLTVGANDFMPLLRNEPCASDPKGVPCRIAVAQALSSFAANYQALLARLSVALALDTGDEHVMVTTYYNPFDGTGSPFEAPADAVLLGIDGRIDCLAAQVDPRNTGLNDIIACIGAAFGATVVDIHPLFDGKALALTHIAEGDVHPNDEGHRVIAGAVFVAFSTP
jgi:lysophospholipase L1-like esterase